jgi:lysophospholipase L1-like esterase
MANDAEVAAVALNTRAEGKGRATSRLRGVSILQIGDSHTSADFFTGSLRKALQARYGDGGPGYVTAGHPHIGVRSATMNITNSSGWSYKALQKTDHTAEFWLSGFNAVASAEGETMTFAADRAITFDMIEIGVVRQPGGGAIDIRLDGKVESRFDLDAPQVDPVVIRLLPNRAATERVKQMSIVLSRAGTVSLSSIALYNRRAGVIYNSVGFPGATVGIINKFDDRLFASELRRIDPQIVVLSFGSNEGFNDNLDLDRYAQNYERAVRKIKATLPSAAIVVIGPPDGNDLPTHCRDRSTRGPCRRAATSRAPHALAHASDGDSDAAVPAPAACVWRTPPKLGAVRNIQRDIAQREGLVYWNWASIMPADCGADRWASQSPPLMAKDRLHFTTSGYRLSADQFAKTLIPVIEKVRASVNAFSNN